MRPFSLALVVAAAMATLALMALAQQTPSAGPNKIIKSVKVGGEGGFDYIFANVKGRRLYTPRGGAKGHLAVFNLDTLEPAGEIDNVSSGGATVDPKSHHGFSTTKPITMWDSTTLKVLKTINVDGRPDGRGPLFLPVRRLHPAYGLGDGGQHVIGVPGAGLGQHLEHRRLEVPALLLGIPRG